MTTYGFLLANHSSYGPILYCFWDMLTCWISLYFVLCLYLMPTLRVTLLKFNDAVYYLDKLEWWSYEVVKNVKRYMQLFRHNTSVWQTDRQTEILYQLRTSALCNIMMSELWFFVNTVTIV